MMENGAVLDSIVREGFSEEVTRMKEILEEEQRY